MWRHILWFCTVENGSKVLTRVDASPHLLYQDGPFLFAYCDRSIEQYDWLVAMFLLPQVGCCSICWCIAVFLLLRPWAQLATIFGNHLQLSLQLAGSLVGNLCSCVQGSQGSNYKLYSVIIYHKIHINYFHHGSHHRRVTRTRERKREQ